MQMMHTVPAGDVAHDGEGLAVIRGALGTQGVKNRKQARSRYGAKKEKG